MRKLVVSLLAALALVAVMLTPGLSAGTAQAASAPSGASAASGVQAKAGQAERKKQKAKKGKKRKGGVPMRTWNRLAHCESTSRWWVNTGNGYYGGLQISPSTWAAFGGKRLASLPHKASKPEQVRVAQRIKNGQGWGAWPACSSKLGLR